MRGIIWVPLLLFLSYITDISGASFKPWYEEETSEETRQEGGKFCGYKRKINSELSEFRVLRYKQDHQDVTYKISKYSPKLSISTINSVISKAFKAWSDVTDLTFTRKNGYSADIDIRFEVRDHGDRGDDPFDGLGMVLAHANNEYIHFDGDENWSTDLHRGVSNLYAIAVHEIGHALGLDHSDVKNAIMYPEYNPSNVVLHLHSDDIKGIQSLYGPKTTRGGYEDEDEDLDDSVYIPQTPVGNRDADDARVPQIPSGFNRNDCNIMRVGNSVKLSCESSRGSYSSSVPIPQIPSGYNKNDCTVNWQGTSSRVNCRKSSSGWHIPSGSSSSSSSDHQIIPFRNSGFSLPSGYNEKDCVVKKMGNSKTLSCKSSVSY